MDMFKPCFHRRKPLLLFKLRGKYGEFTESQWECSLVKSIMKIN